MIIQVRVVQEKIVEVDYDGRRTSKDEIGRMFSEGMLSAGDNFLFTDGKGYRTRVVGVAEPQVEVLR